MSLVKKKDMSKRITEQPFCQTRVGGSGFCPSINYQIIKDKNKLIDFINWLPNLEPNETYYLCLFARSKYCKDELGNNLFPHINSDREQMARFLCKKEDLFDKIKQLECEVGSYKRKGQTVPQDSLALYITVNPRSYKKATKTTIVKLLDIVMGTKPIFDLNQFVISEIHRSCSRKIYVDFDFDDVDLSETKKIIEQSINIDCLTILKTKGGFHLLVEVEKVKKEFVKTWYNSITKINGCDIKGDNMIPVVGSTQGGFCPLFLEW